MNLKNEFKNQFSTAYVLLQTLVDYYRIKGPKISKKWIFEHFDF